MINKYIKSEFLKNSLALILGTVLAQLIPILLQVVLRRVYSASDFGLFAVYTSITGMVMVIATMRYETTIVIPEKDEDAMDILSGSIMLSFVINCFLLGVFILFSDTIITLFEFPLEIKTWLYFVPLSVFLFSSYRAINNWLIRKKRFKIASTNKVVRRSSEGFVQVASNYSGFYGGLILGNIIGDFTNLLLGIFQIRKNSFFKSLTNFANIIVQLKRYKNFPIYGAVPALFNSISLFLPVIIINKFYTQEVIGQYDLSRQMLALPLALVSITVSQVLSQKVAENKNKDLKVFPLVRNIAFALIGLSIVGVAVVSFFGVEIFTFAFGNQWESAASFAQILVFSYAVKFIVSPLSAVFTSLEKIKVSSTWQVFYFGVICCLFLLEGISIQQFLWYYMLIDIVAYLIYYGLIYYVCKRYDRKLI